MELTPFAIVFSALIALIVGWLFGGRVNRKLTREQAAITLIFEREIEFRDDFRALWMMVQKHKDDADFFKNLASHFPIGTDGQPWDADRKSESLPVEQKQWLTVSTCLNYYEAVAVAIDRGAIDKRTVSEFLKQRFIYHMENLYPFVEAVRKTPGLGKPDTWAPAHKLARKWGADIPKYKKR